MYCGSQLIVGAVGFRLYSKPVMSENSAESSPDVNRIHARGERRRRRSRYWTELERLTCIHFLPNCHLATWRPHATIPGGVGQPFRPLKPVNHFQYLPLEYLPPIQSAALNTLPLQPEQGDLRARQRPVRVQRMTEDRLLPGCLLYPRNGYTIRQLLPFITLSAV